MATANLLSCENLVELKSDKLEVGQITDFVTSNDCGAISMFIGTTRDNDGGCRVVHLEYEAYNKMAEDQMMAIVGEMRKKWHELKKIAIIHRLGIVPVSEASVIIAVSSPHRAQALTAVSFAIDELKSKVPIWKKEIYESGESNWKANKECAWSTCVN